VPFGALATTASAGPGKAEARRATGPIVSDSWILGRWRKGRPSGALFQPVRAGGRRRRRRELADTKALLFCQPSWPVRGPAIAGWRDKSFQKSISWGSLGPNAPLQYYFGRRLGEALEYPDKMVGHHAGHLVHRYVAPSVRQSLRALLHGPARSILVACSPTVIVESN
jgi:hypothetical protein